MREYLQISMLSKEIADRYNLYVVHDTAQSVGSEYKGKKTGCFGDVATFSFHGTKNLTTGEGGALVTNNDEIAELTRFNVRRVLINILI